MPEIVIAPGRTEDASVVAQLILETDLPLFRLYGDGDISLWREITEWEWRAQRGIYSSSMSLVARCGPEIVGLLIGYTPTRGDEIDWGLEASREHIDSIRWMRLEAVRPLSNFLFPAIPRDSYYVQNLVTTPAVRGRGLGRQLMEHAFAVGRSAGCVSCCLDVASTNPAVDFI